MITPFAIIGLYRKRCHLTAMSVSDINWSLSEGRPFDLSNASKGDVSAIQAEEAVLIDSATGALFSFGRRPSHEGTVARTCSLFRSGRPVIRSFSFHVLLIFRLRIG